MLLPTGENKTVRTRQKKIGMLFRIISGFFRSDKYIIIYQNSNRKNVNVMLGKQKADDSLNLIRNVKDRIVKVKYREKLINEICKN